MKLYGGFGEKGRTALGVESGGYRLLLDAGVKTSARERDDYYPAIPAEELRSSNALIVTHGHEDHAAALGWCIAGGFRGGIFMTPETRRELRATLPGYAPAGHVGLVERASVETLPVGRDVLRLGPFRLSTGRSGHIAGGLWCRIEEARASFHYCGDVAPGSPVFAMDAPLPADTIAIDASYGDDDVPAAARAAEIARWIEAHPDGCVVPTPLYGRSAELLAVIPGRVALAPGMREALRLQTEGTQWLSVGAAHTLAQRLASAVDWRRGDALPRAVLLCHDAMGLTGPSREVLAEAQARRWPTLFTGHLPEGSPGALMVTEGRAAWIRLPTHPTLSQNRALVEAGAARTVLGHSCDRAALGRLARHIPALRADVATGDAIEL
ncbi:MAG TPA: MBL fold metallo-hydrolase [Casimicrobiaceae bacterium]